VLSPNWPASQWILGAAFVLMVAVLVVRARRRSRHQYRQFKLFRSTEPRQRMYRTWLRGSFLTFGVISSVLIALSWQYVPLVLSAVRTTPWYADVAHQVDLPLIAVGIAAALVIVPVALLFFVGRHDEVPALGDIQALIPRNLAEVRLGALLAINAGVVEELVFRLALPAVLYGAIGNVWVALGVSVLLFGGLHLYQGVAGVAGTALLGLLLLALYVASGSIVVPIVVHALIDLRSFVLIPLLVLRVHLPADEKSI
jgi:uncharacterized protein